mgnify:FL=1
MVTMLIRKSFPDAHTLDQVDYDLRRGEIHALVGKNGAGASTLRQTLARAWSAALRHANRPVKQVPKSLACIGEQLSPENIVI